jgi:hypothetical protein
MRHINFIFLILLAGCCTVGDSEIGKPEKYILTEINISEDCNAYQIRYYEGKNIFRFSLSGTCKQLTMDNYIKGYSDYLSLNQDSLVFKRGHVIFDYYSFKDTNNVLVDSIIEITKREFNSYVSLSEIEENSFTLKIFDSNQN